MNKLNEIKKSLQAISNTQVNNLLLQTKVNKGELEQNITVNEDQEKYRKEKWKLSDALDETVKDIIKRNDPKKKEQLITAFDDFRDLMIKTITDAESAITDEAEQSEDMIG